MGLGRAAIGQTARALRVAIGDILAPRAHCGPWKWFLGKLNAVDPKDGPGIAKGPLRFQAFHRLLETCSQEVWPTQGYIPAFPSSLRGLEK